MIRTIVKLSNEIFDRLFINKSASYLVSSVWSFLNIKFGDPPRNLSNLIRLSFNLIIELMSIFIPAPLWPRESRKTIPLNNFYINRPPSPIEIHKT